MASLTSRGKAFAGLAFLASAALFAGAAVTLVKASGHEPTSGRAAPRPQPTLVFGSVSPTPSPVTTSAAPSASPTATTAASPSPSPTATRSASPRPRATRSPVTILPDGLYAKAELNPAGGDIFPGDLITLTAHATDGEGEISLLSLSWGDGTVVHGGSGTSCPAPKGGDCADFRFTHRYNAAGTYHILLQLTSGGETAAIPFQIEIKPCSGPCATPSPSAP